MNRLANRVLKFAAVMACAWGVTPALADWTLSSDKTTMTDGDWVLKVSVKNASVTVSGVDGFTTGTRLDLAASITDANGEGAFSVVSVSGLATADTKPVLEEVVLPDALSTIGGSAFAGCTALRSVTPFLPSNLSSLGYKAFAGCSALEGDLVFARSCTLGNNYGDVNTFEGASSITSADLTPFTGISPYMFQSCSSLTNVILNSSISSVGRQAFNGCGNLRTVTPFLPDSLTSIGIQAFNGCPKLSGTLRIGFNSKTSFAANYGTDSYAFQGSGITNLLVGAGVGQLFVYTFKDCKSLERVEFFGSTSLSANSFANCTNCKEVVFQEKPASIVSGAFNGWAAYQSRWLVPSRTQGWSEYISSESTLKPYSKLTDEEKARYVAVYGSDEHLLGYTVSPAKQWVVATDADVPVRMLTIEGSPEKYEAERVDPPYGFIADVSGDLPLHCTAPEFHVENTYSLYRNTGLILETYDGEKWIDPHSIPGTAYDYEPEEAGWQRLTWQWGSEPVAYNVEVVQPAVAAGLVMTNSTPDLNGFYTLGRTASYTVSVNPGYRFVCWLGDVPEEQRQNLTVEIPIDGRRKITPYILAPSAKWVFDASTGILTDGNWRFTATRSGNNISITGVVLDLGIPDLDLSREVEGGYAITSIGGLSGRKGLKRIVLPSTLTSLGTSAFTGCTALEEVSPFLPDTITSFGYQAFEGCTSLTGALRIAHNSSTSYGQDYYGWYTSTFKDTKITSVDIGTGSAGLYNWAFGNCTALSELTLPGSVGISYTMKEWANIGTFVNTPKLKTIRFTTDRTVDFNALAFTGQADYTVRVFVPLKRDGSAHPGWAALETSEDVTNRFTVPTADDLVKFRAAYPDAKKPRFVWTHGATHWFVNFWYPDGAPGFKVLFR